MTAQAKIGIRFVEANCLVMRFGSVYAGRKMNRGSPEREEMTHNRSAIRRPIFIEGSGTQ